MRRVSIVLAVVLIAAFASPSVFAADAVLTEADFKKMKVKQLRSFLSERGLECAGCEDKSEFVKECVKHAATPPTASKGKVVVPDGTFWEVWAGYAAEACEAAAASKSASADAKATICANVKTATESVFEQYGRRTATKLKKKPAALLKTSVGEVYQAAGKKMLGKLAAFCFKNAAKCKSSSAVQSLLEKDDAAKGVKIITYITNVGIENTNPMYEALKDKNLDKDEL